MGLVLKCHSCSAEFGYSMLYECPLCHGVLDVRYDYENIRLSSEFTQAFVNSTRACGVLTVFSLWNSVRP